MGEKTTTADVRTETQKIEMADGFAEYEAEYRDTDEQREVVYEDGKHIIVADHRGHEINGWSDQLGISRDDLRATFRTIADEKMGRSESHEIFSYADPVVFDKFADADATDELTENGILTDHPTIRADMEGIHGEPSVENDAVVIFADSHGHELSEWSSLTGTDFEEFYQAMHDIARKHDGSDGVDHWSSADPVVFDARTFDGQEGDGE